MKLTIKSESLTTRSLQERIDTFEITDADATVLVEWDYQQQLADPNCEHPKRRSAQAAADAQLSNPEYNNWHAYHRQDRKLVKFCSLEVWNEYGDQALAADPSAEQENNTFASALERDADEVERGALVRAAINALPPTQRAIIEAIYDAGRRSKDIAAERGVSPAAVSKAHKKALAHLKVLLLEAGVNFPGVSGLPLSDTEGVAQEGKIQ